MQEQQLFRLHLKIQRHYTFKITKQRGQWIERKGYWITATFHPSALLRDESKKRPAWEDFKSIQSKLIELNENEVEN